MEQKKEIISFEDFLQQNTGKVPLVYNKLNKKLVAAEKNYVVNKNRELSTLYNSTGYLKETISFPLCKFDIFD